MPLKEKEKVKLLNTEIACIAYSINSKKHLFNISEFGGGSYLYDVLQLTIFIPYDT